MASLPVESNQIKSYGFHRRPQKKLAKKSQKFGLPKDPWTIAHENLQNWGFTCSGDHLTMKINRTQKLTKRGIYLLRGSFDLENGPICPSRPTSAIAKVLMTSTNFFCKNDVGNLDHQKINGL
ncbi:hypothetical protein H5410_056514 [Solanum commersonii]|uniref:Uncharacterized protein n=1 Tax=Solanum commersonii TaxID=4109 RepID=A0A9J5WMG9_SOLCO|nr:hypothetical protein H5410_056514 [Solanum commersonii]